jgi:hypothetical protein
MIFEQTKQQQNHKHRSMKALIPISPKKKNGHYNCFKMDYPKIYNIKKTQAQHYGEPNNIISTQLIANFEE